MVFRGRRPHLHVEIMEEVEQARVEKVLCAPP